MSHDSILYHLAQVTGQHNSVSTPFQLVLNFISVPYGMHFLFTKQLLIAPMQKQCIAPTEDFDIKVMMQNSYSVDMAK